MRYELALRLQEAGWPQPEVSDDPDENTYPGKFVFEHDDFDAGQAYVPALDELIEAHKVPGWSLSFMYLLDDRYPDYQWQVRFGLEAVIANADLRDALAELWLTPAVQEAIKKSDK